MNSKEKRARKVFKEAVAPAENAYIEAREAYYKALDQANKAYNLVSRETHPQSTIIPVKDGELYVTGLRDRNGIK